MKKTISAILCVFFTLSTFMFCGFAGKPTFACNLNENIIFYYDHKIFSYSLSKNIKHSEQFDINYEINKLNRFSTKVERKHLLQHMLNIGIEKNVALEYLFPNISKTITRVGKSITVKPRNAVLHTSTNSEKVFIITPEIEGVELNKTSIYEEICKKYLNDQPLEIQIDTKKITPQTTTAQLKRFINLRADFSTNISSSSKDRKHNIKNALNSLNLTEIAPNEVFSFNKTVGKRTPENGYRQAKIIVNNEFVEGLGGGVCQVSTTLYNAALLAGCEIIEANKHSRQVGYVKYGFDAMVNFGSSDLKFRNNTNEKLTIVTNFTPSTARIRIFGENLDLIEYKLKNEIVSTTEAEYEILPDKDLEYLDKVNYDDESFVIKPAINGMVVKSYREKYLNGELVEKTLLRTDSFKAQNGIKITGTKPRDLYSNLFH